MPDQLPISNQEIANQPATSLQESAAGPTPYHSQAGLQTPLFGPEAVPANPFRAQVNEKAQPTQGTSGLSGTSLSGSASLQLSLESRLRQTLDVNGSPEYELTWKHWDIGSGPPICALRASGRRTSGKGFTGWPTPAATDTARSQDSSNQRMQAGHQADLPTVAQLAGWPTPQVFDSTGDGEPRALRYKGNAPSEAGNTRDPNKPGSYRGDLKDIEGLAGWSTPRATERTGGNRTSLRQDAQLAGWGTPTQTDYKGGNLGPDKARLKYQVLGAATSSSPAETGKRGGLNPAFPSWLQGFPIQWCQAAIQASRTLKQQRKPEQ